MPVPLLNAYVAELPRISAHESLLEAQRVAVGSGRMKRSERRRIVGSWQRLSDQARPALRPRTRAQAAAMAGQVGIRVVRVKKEAPDG